MAKMFTREITDIKPINGVNTIASGSVYKMCGNHETISKDLIIKKEVIDKEAIVKEVVSEVLSKDDLIQDYITPFLIKHLEKYLANPDILFEKDRKIKELEKRILDLECENNRLDREIGDLKGRVMSLEIKNDRIKDILGSM